MNIAEQIDHSVELQIWVLRAPQQLLYNSWEHFACVCVVCGGGGGVKTVKETKAIHLPH